MNKKTFIALLLLITSLPTLAVAAEAELRIEDAWIAEAPPVSKVMVAYMTMINTGSQTVDIVSAESDVYSSIEFHETRYEDGMARMIRHESLDIPAGERLVLKRGGPHFMLFNPAKHLVAGDTVTIRLTTKNNESKVVSIPVKKAQF
jgi:periplasmic copper chaperone A